MGSYVVGVAGGSGAPYTLRVLEGLLNGGHQVFAVFSNAGRRVFELEVDIHLTGNPDSDRKVLAAALGLETDAGQLRLFALDDFGAAIASGSFETDGMVIVPCSMGTLGRIAMGAGSSLLERAADVTLKERRKLVVVPREAPLNLIHLRNMATLTEAGGEVFPAMPGFYQRPQTVQDVIDSVAGRVLERLGVESRFLRRWTGPQAANRLLREED